MQSMQIVQIITLVLSSALTIDRLIERLFPNNATAKMIDQKLSALGTKDVDGQ